MPGIHRAGYHVIYSTRNAPHPSPSYHYSLIVSHRLPKFAGAACLLACKLCLTIASAAAAAASRSFCRLLSFKYLSASGLMRKIRRIISSLGSAWASFRFSSFAFRIVPRFRDIMTDFVRRVPVTLSMPAEECMPRIPAGAERRFRRAACSCCRLAVALAMASEVRMRLSDGSK